MKFRKITGVPINREQMHIQLPDCLIALSSQLECSVNNLIYSLHMFQGVMVTVVSRELKG